MKEPHQKWTLLGFALLTVALAGCQSGQFTHDVSPQISGRVLAADTHQPLSGASVTRNGAGLNSDQSTPRKGGQILTEASGVRTDAGGRFLLPGESVFAPFRHPGWWSVPVVYQATGYTSLQTNYTGASVTGHTADGMAEVDAGDVLLQPAH